MPTTCFLLQLPTPTKTTQAGSRPPSLASPPPPHPTPTHLPTHPPTHPRTSAAGGRLHQPNMLRQRLTQHSAPMDRGCEEGDTFTITKTKTELGHAETHREHQGFELPCIQQTYVSLSQALLHSVVRRTGRGGTATGRAVLFERTHAATGRQRTQHDTHWVRFPEPSHPLQPQQRSSRGRP